MNKGSEWNKWDLHVHTPSSINQNYGGDTNEAWEKFISDLEMLPSEFKVIGINDYIFIDGYKKVLDYKSKGRLINIDLILPIIELRIDKFASIGDEAWKKVNLHIIFSDTLDPEIIDEQFLKGIRQKLKIFVEGVEPDFNEVITRTTLAELGKKIKSASPTVIHGSDIFVGFSNLAFNYDKVHEALEATTFRGKFLTAVGKTEWDTMRWTGSPADKRNVINNANFVFTALEKHEYYTKQKQKLTEQKVNDLLIDCSDAHCYSDSPEKDRIGNCNTWIKANATFEGLKQVANSPSRIFVGEIPPLLKRVSENPTKYINTLHFERIVGSSLIETWFDNISIDLNPGLVAIIGNKGNGKSALTDAIGLVGNTPNTQFSFLDSNKFRKLRPNRSEHFDACLTWETGIVDIWNLSKNPNANSVEKVKYIPQGFLEKLCNESHENFLDELRNVIFTHIPEAEKYGQNNLSELEDYMTDTIQKEIGQIQIELKETNKTIAKLEALSTFSYLEHLKNALGEKEKELDGHDAIKPLEKSQPTDPSLVEQNKSVSLQITSKRRELENIELSLAENIKQQKELTKNIAELNKVLGSINVLKIQYDKLYSEITPQLSEYGITQDIILLSINPEPINEVIKTYNTSLDIVNKNLDEDETGNLYEKRSVIKSEIQTLQETLDEPSKQYQSYIDALSQWNTLRANIVGSKESEGSLEYYKDTIDYIENRLNSDIDSAIEKRTLIIRRIFEKKLSILNVFKTFYKPITDFIESYGGVLQEYEITLDIENRIVAFEEKFFDQISAGAKGTFIGSIEGREKLQSILNNYDLNNTDSLISFLNEISIGLKFDQRDGFKGERRDVLKQLKSGYTVESLYEHLFGLEYLQPVYKLKFNNKDIPELSPGERGALLLIFYLALDQNSIPLVIDQPEENLDNQGVFELLAQFIIKAKDIRQIIIVTHNPNLAVVCDADQIIHVKIEKTNKNKVVIKSGGLENPEINETVIDILEGTLKAFGLRDSTYKIISR